MLGFLIIIIIVFIALIVLLNDKGIMCDFFKIKKKANILTSANSIKGNSENSINPNILLQNPINNETINLVKGCKNIHGIFAKGANNDVFIADSEGLIVPDLRQGDFVTYYEVILYNKNDMDKFDQNFTIHKFRESDMMKSKQSSQAFINDLIAEKIFYTNATKDFELNLVSKTALGDIVKYQLIDRKGVDIARGRNFESYLINSDMAKIPTGASVQR